MRLYMRLYIFFFGRIWPSFIIQKKICSYPSQRISSPYREPDPQEKHTGESYPIRGYSTTPVSENSIPIPGTRSSRRTDRGIMSTLYM